MVFVLDKLPLPVSVGYFSLAERGLAGSLKNKSTFIINGLLVNV